VIWSRRSSASFLGQPLDVSAGHLALDSQLCFLFHRISRDLTAAYRPLLDELGLTYPQYLVMLVLWEEDGLGVGEIGTRLHLDSGTLSPLLRRMQVAGLLTRHRSADDERRVSISLTTTGRALRDRAAAVPQQIAARLVDDLSGYRHLHADLTTLAARLEAGAQATGTETTIPAASRAP
jgi:MarR family transcriptional regulator, organic hydroperoxide resistance regulator